MFLSNISIRRPVAICCFIIALVLLGLNAYRKMGLEFLPSIDLPYITIVTIYPGASPEEIETDIAKRVEDAVGTLDGLKHLSNSCMENSCLTFLEFNLGVDVDVAATDVREKLDLILNDLPADADKPKILKYDINAVPVLNIALTGDLSTDELYDYADNELRNRLSVISGVADVQLVGGAEREVDVLLDREALASRGLSSMSVVEAIQKGIRTIPSGRVRENEIEYSVKFDAEYKEVESIGDLEIFNQNGTRCYLKDLGRIIMTTDEMRQAAYVDGRPCIAVRVVKKSDANAVRVVNSVRATVAKLMPALPGGMELIWVSDDGAFIEATVDSTTSDIWQGILLTAAILFFFLFNFRSTLIVAISMPLSFVISLYFLQLLDYTLNVSTLLAIGLSVGILVTNSIVVIENVVKRLNAGASPRDAARVGTGEVGVAVLASAGTNLVVLFPIAVMQSMIGLFFSPFAWTMVIVTVVSLFISFTLTPILAAILLKKPASEGRKSFVERIQIVWDGLFARLSGGYGASLRVLSQHRWIAVIVLLLTAALFVQSLSLAPKVGFGFFSEADRGSIFVKMEFPTFYNLEQTEKRVGEADKVIRDMLGGAQHGLRHTLTTIGKVEGVMGQSTEGVYLAQMLLEFTDKTQRAESINLVVDRLRARFEDFPDSIVTVSIPAGIGGQNYPIELEIAGPELDVLDQLASGVMDIAGAIPGVVDPDSSTRAGKPELRIRPRRAVLSDLGIPVVGLGMALRANLAGLEAGSFKRGDRTYDIRVKLDEEPGKSQVEQFLFPGAAGHPLVLTNLADIEDTAAPVQILRRDKRRISKVFSQLLPDLPLGTAVNQLSAGIEQAKILPAGYDYRFMGTYEIMSEGNASMLEAAILAMLLTYLVLSAILESFRLPIIILVTIPLGLVGLLWALYLTGESITMFVLLGSVMLIGIVVNNAILVMDETSLYIRQGMPPHEAMIKASEEKLRPVLMITLAAILGMLPLAISTGVGSEMRTGIGIASAGGLASSAVLMLIALPAIYFLTRRRTPKRKDSGTRY